MAISDRVHIGRRFQRAIRIDTDLGDPQALEGFICPQSFTNVLLAMGKHVFETGQGAFTWTGPYGSGKSSLVIALSALLNGSKGLQQRASSILGRRITDQLWKALPPRSRGWRILPVVGRRDSPAHVIGEALEQYGFIQRNKRREWTDAKVVETLTTAAADQPKAHGGLVVFIDEMGKFLEGAAQEGTDIYIFQQLAETASRSKRRLIVVGILHQAFEEYANRLSREARDEWSKIQGRFIDLAVNTGGEEQIDLIARAIESDHRPKKPGPHAQAVSEIVRRNRASSSGHLAEILERCWPLHPTVACLLGPISRRRFGQNQRSIFGFLNSAEPNGFQDFLKSADDRELYELDRLWDYLRVNLEPSILASPDSHRWSLAVEAIERCETIGGERLHICLLKTIALIELFKERSGLIPSFDLLRVCSQGDSPKTVKAALDQLIEWSFVIFKKYLDAYAIYAGSDFDIDQAVETAREGVKEVDFTRLRTLAGIQPILAKRHYHDTGALRWFDVNLAPLDNLIHEVACFEPENGTIGQFLLAIPIGGQSEEVAQEMCNEASRQNHEWDIVVGLSQRSWAIVDLARELVALEKVRNERGELAGDAVARREVDARIADLQTHLEAELHRAFDSAIWYRKRHQPRRLPHAELNSLASELADRRFPRCPRLHNELLNRHRPSANAIAAQNALLKQMVVNEGRPRLGIEGFPAEGGLFSSLLEAPGLYVQTPQGWRFVPPASDEVNQYRLAPLWDVAEDHLKANKDRVVLTTEIYDLWRQPPFGVKDGLMPVLVVAFVLSRRDVIAIYRQAIFQPRFKDLDVEYLTRDPADIQLRWMDLSDVSRCLLSGMAEVVRSLDASYALAHLEPFDVAKGLVAIFESLEPWTKRTMRLSANATRVRGLFRQANDPNKFLFDDIPSALGGQADLLDEANLERVVSTVREGLEELVQAYPTMLQRLRDTLLAELQVPNTFPQALAELRERADNVRQLTGDYRLEAFVNRLAQFDGRDSDVEGIASLAAEKPLRDWVDLDLDRAAVEMTDMAQKFVRLEAFARVKGRRDKRHAMAVVVGIGGRPTPVLEEFDIADSDRTAVEHLISEVETALQSGDPRHRHVILAALAELSARYMQQTGTQQSKDAVSKKRGVS